MSSILQKGRVRTAIVAVMVTLPAALILASTGGPRPDALFTAPFAAGDNSGNIPLSSSERVIMNRWVAQRDGVLDSIYLRVKTAGATGCSDDPGKRYGGGTGGSWIVTTHTTLADGTPDMRTELARSVLSPCTDKRSNSIAVPLHVQVQRGVEYATLVRNGDPDPATNFSSQNFLYVRRGLVGANASNNRSPNVARTFYGLDPREVVGFSRDGGRTWRIPGGPYGRHGGAAFVPTFVEVFADGFAGGQPYYSSSPLSGRISMSFRAKLTGKLSGVGAYATGLGRADVDVRVNGAHRATVTLRGSGFLRAGFAPTSVAEGDTITLSTVAGGGGLALQREYAGAMETRLLGLGTDSPAFLTTDPESVAPLYPLAQRGSPILGFPPA